MIVKSLVIGAATQAESHPEPVLPDQEDNGVFALNLSGCNVTNVTVRAIADVLGER